MIVFPMSFDYFDGHGLAHGICQVSYDLGFMASGKRRSG